MVFCTLGRGAEWLRSHCEPDVPKGAGQARLLSVVRCEAHSADSGAVTLIQQFGSAANLNIHLHCLVQPPPAAASAFARRPGR